jgi:Ca-activated chloride channel family protein
MLNLPRVEGTVILAFDVSGSMAADDLKPTRMEAAKTAARDFIEKQPGTVQVGVVAFSDNGFSVQPPTADQAAILAAINRLTAQRGTSLANGITASLNTIAASRAQGIIGETNGEPPSLSNRAPEPTSTPTPLPKGTYTSAAIVLLTDGENNEMPDPLAVAQTAADRGVRIYTVAVGSPAGTTLKINGFTVHTQLNEEMLKQISAITGGEYYNADNEEELRAIYDNLDPQLLLKPQNTEITALFAGASIILLLIGGALSLVWFSRLP